MLSIVRGAMVMVSLHINKSLIKTKTKDYRRTSIMVRGIQLQLTFKQFMKNHEYFMRKGKTKKERGKKDTLPVEYFHLLLLKEIETCAAEAVGPLSMTR